MSAPLYVLVVEDSTDDQLLIKRAFGLAGDKVVVTTARDGLEAIDYLQGVGDFADREQFPYPCFIMTDLKMSPGDGFAVLEHVRNSMAVVPVTVFSGSRDLDDVKRAYQLGAAGYFVKPQVFQEFCNLIKSVYDLWLKCERPALDLTGKHLKTTSRGKLGERFHEV
jgi:CheY-like chemotaxis protein